MSLMDFIYGTAPGRAIMKTAMRLHLDRVECAFLRSPLSRPVIGPFARAHGISLTLGELRSFRTFQEFFSRRRENPPADTDPTHLISPCDSWLSVYPVEDDSSFLIKGFHYRLADLFRDEKLAEKMRGGSCFIFRLCANDYHRYCYVDSGVQGAHHHIPGELHSVQPEALEAYPVLKLNKRCWSVLECDSLGTVVQTEIGAFAVGEIVNDRDGGTFRKGEEKGHFELGGSTIALFFERGRVELLPELKKALETREEVRVKYGMWIGTVI